MFLDHIPVPVVLDVTLRDGGYLNNWAFSESQLRTAIVSAIDMGADILELGYAGDDEGLPVALSWNRWQIEAIMDLKRDARLAVMCRPSVSRPDYVVESRKDLIDLIRIPVDLRNTPLANRLADICVHHGVPFSFNLTGLSLYSLQEIDQAMKSLSDEAAVIYLADSRGALRPDDVAGIIATVRKTWSGRIGFHAHNSLGLAGANTRVALDLGCGLIDGSLFGIGLGGRNLDLIEAVELAKMSRADLPEGLHYNGLDEFALGVPPNSEDRKAYQMAAERNIKMEWIALMIEQLGVEATDKAIAHVPWGCWFSHLDMEQYMEPTIWRSIIWS